MTTRIRFRSTLPTAAVLIAVVALALPLSPALAADGAVVDCRAAAAASPADPVPVPTDPCDPLVALFSTVGTFTELTFGAGGVPPIPAGFFFPGSQPFAGSISLSGFPLVPGGGEADTAVRLSALPQPDGEDYPAFAAPVAVHLAGLALSSIDPISVTGAEGESDEWLVSVDLAGDQPEGTLAARFDSPEGGAFDAFLPLQPAVLFIRLADVQAALDGELDPSEIAVRSLDLAEQGVDAIELAFQEVPFATADIDGDGCGGFEVGYLPDGLPVLVSTAEPYEPVRHVFEPPPKPAKKCNYVHGSSTASANPPCLPACPAPLPAFSKGKCQTIANCKLFQHRRVKCARQGWCAEVFVLVSCA